MVTLACLNCADIAGRRLISPFTVIEVSVLRKSFSLIFIKDVEAEVQALMSERDMEVKEWPEPHGIPVGLRTYGYEYVIL